MLLGNMGWERYPVTKPSFKQAMIQWKWHARRETMTELTDPHTRHENDGYCCMKSVYK